MCAPLIVELPDKPELHATRTLGAPISRYRNQSNYRNQSYDDTSGYDRRGGAGHGGSGYPHNDGRYQNGFQPYAHNSRWADAPLV